MMTSQKNEIQEVINHYQNFSECIIIDFNWKKLGTAIELTLRYIYDDEGHIHKSMDDWQVLVLRFSLVQELKISNALTQAMCDEPDRLNWGFNEIALVKLEDNSDFVNPFKKFSIPFHHLAIFWENQRRIDIVFSILEIIRK